MSKLFAKLVAGSAKAQVRASIEAAGLLAYGASPESISAPDGATFARLLSKADHAEASLRAMIDAEKATRAASADAKVAAPKKAAPKEAAPNAP